MDSNSQFGLLLKKRLGPFFVTQALGAFNGNVFRNAMAILVTFGIAGLSQQQINFYVNLAAAAFILPMFLFSAQAGQLAEKYEKSGLIRRIKLMEIAVMLLAVAGLMLQNIAMLMTVLFLMGTLASLFGPVKYSILPQALHDDELVTGNALVEAATFLSILLGTMLGGWLIGLSSGTAAVSGALLALSVLGYVAARSIPVAPAAAPQLQLNWNPFTETWRNLRFVRARRSLLLAMMGMACFWFYGATLLAQLPNYTKTVLGGNGQVVTLLLTAFSLGIGAGSLLCGKLSGGRVEIGLVPLGSIGLALSGIDLYFAAPHAASVVGLGAAEFFDLAQNRRVLGDLALIGLFAGLYIVPLYALIQSRCEPEYRSRVIAGTNIMNALFMVFSAVMAVVLLGAGLTIPQLLLAVALLNAAIAVFVYSLLPEFLMRFVVWLLLPLFYRIERRGLNQIPEEGPVIVVCNHVSYVDAVILGGCVRRPVRFVMYHKIFRIPLLSFIFRTARAIPIAPAKEDPALLERAYEEIDQALQNGEVIGIFPEGGLTPDGEIQEFRNGIERILARTPAPVVPMALRGLWNSMWSRRDSRLGRSRIPRRFRARIELIADAPIPPEQVSADLLEAKIRALRGVAA